MPRSDQTRPGMLSVLKRLERQGKSAKSAKPSASSSTFPLSGQRASLERSPLVSFVLPYCASQCGVCLLVDIISFCPGVKKVDKFSVGCWNRTAAYRTVATTCRIWGCSRSTGRVQPNIKRAMVKTGEAKSSDVGKELEHAGKACEPLPVWSGDPTARGLRKLV